MTNHGGCAILNEMITYPDRKETRKKFQECHGGVMKKPIFFWYRFSLLWMELSYTPLWKSVFYKVH